MMNKKIMAVLAVAVMTAACFVGMIGIATNDDSSAADPINSVELTDASLLNNTQYWIKTELQGTMLVVTNNTNFINDDGTVTTDAAKINVTINQTRNPGSGNINVIIFKNTTDGQTEKPFVIPAGLSISSSNNTTGKGDTNPTIYVNVGWNQNSAAIPHAFTDIEIYGTMSGINIYALFGSITIKNGGIYDSGYRGTIDTYNSSNNNKILMRYDPYSSSTAASERGYYSKIVVENGGLIRSAEIYTNNSNGYSTADTNIALSLFNIENKAIPGSNEYSKIVIQLTYTATASKVGKIIDVSGSFYGLDSAAMCLRACRTNVDVNFGLTDYYNLKFDLLHFGNYDGTFMNISNNLTCSETAQFIVPEAGLQPKLKTTGAVDIYMVYRIQYSSSLLGDPQQFHYVVDAGGNATAYAFIYLHTTDGVKTVVKQDNEVAMGSTLKDLLSSYKIEVEDGYQFVGWYYYDQWGIEHKVDMDKEIDENMNIFAKAVVKTETQPTDTLLIIGVVLLSFLGAAVATSLFNRIR